MTEMILGELESQFSGIDDKIDKFKLYKRFICVIFTNYFFA